ncbi:hypothetical protein GPU89_21075 [Burkholderia cepacia]|uniref:ankyrin repeat domain-containing protein n=1 Tax=Burkholderia cepacia TaxID=292 RepID=UPI0019E1A938|nr:hypothetical protein [Burkholderia cepacia]NLA19046.1 hypothetical protein [Burkholderia cepacia]
MTVTKKTLQEVFDAYKRHPEFLGLNIEDVKQRGALDSTLLHIASRTGNLEYINVVVNAGADIKIRGDFDSMPLHEAAQAVELLLSIGAHTTLKNEFQQIPLDVAILSEKRAVCELLRQRHPKKRK